MEDSKIRTIGGCQVCRRSAVLVNGACDGCAKKYDPRLFALAARLRREPGFKRTCYEALGSDDARSEFVALFGPIEPRAHATGRPNTWQGPR